MAIIGRTGSGKSTLLLSVLRFDEIVSGKILYDGVDITALPRRSLREAITIIPQEPTLFSGTVKSNLDPAGEVPGEVLEAALQSCGGIASFHGIRDVVTSEEILNDTHGSGISLDTPVAAKGESLSHGQRQVLSLCRALVRKNKLMLLDEATASMDYEADKGMQRTLREIQSTGGRTLVTVAHRLRTIIDYDRVVVLGGGRVLENGSPKELWEKREVFWDMVSRSGDAGVLKNCIGVE